MEKLGFETIPSEANFIFTRCKTIEGGALYRALKSKGILVRHWDKPTIADWCRVTIGSREQMDMISWENLGSMAVAEPRERARLLNAPSMMWWLLLPASWRIWMVMLRSMLLPMDESLILTAVDLSGRGMLYYDLQIPAQKVLH